MRRLRLLWISSPNSALPRECCCCLCFPPCCPRRLTHAACVRVYVFLFLILFPSLRLHTSDSAIVLTVADKGSCPYRSSAGTVFTVSTDALAVRPYRYRYRCPAQRLHRHSSKCNCVAGRQAPEGVRATSAAVHVGRRQRRHGLCGAFAFGRLLCAGCCVPLVL